MQRHADSRIWLRAWVAEVRNTEWQGPADIEERYSSASFLEDRRVVFNVGGNKYRMEIQVSYKKKAVFIKRIGTHAEYDRWK
jgi:mRNA interferase HigB